MIKRIRTTIAAEIELLTISQYLLSEFGLPTLNRFHIEYDEKVRLIANYPLRYPLLNERTKLRKAVLNSHCIILYMNYEQEVHILNVFDTRRNPGLISNTQ